MQNNSSYFDVLLLSCLCKYIHIMQGELSLKLIILGVVVLGGEEVIE
jgi:hypothetical protein